MEDAADTEDSKGGVKKNLKRRDAPEKDPSEPKEPESVFAFYCTERMPEMKTNYPEMSAPEIKDLLLSEWEGLPTDKKQRYLDAAAANKARYVEELADFATMKGPPEKKPKVALDQAEELPAKQTEPLAEEETKPNGKSTPSKLTTTTTMARQEYIPGTNINIFTDQFLQHNREVEAELRRLQTTHTELTEENTLLDRHVKGMQALTTKLSSEAEAQQGKNSAMVAYLASLRGAVVEALKGVTVPGLSGCPATHNADECVNILNTVVSTAAAEHADLVARVTTQLGEQLSYIQNK